MKAYPCYTLAMQLLLSIVFIIALAIAQEDLSTPAPSSGIGSNATNNITVVIDDDLNNTNTTVAPTASLSPSFSPISFNDTDSNSADTDKDDDSDGLSLPEINATLPPNITLPPEGDNAKPLCQSLGIFGRNGCHSACFGVPYSIQYLTEPLEDAPGAIKLKYSGFACQCLSAETPVDCEAVYSFRTCRAARIYNCDLSSSSSRNVDQDTVANISNSSNSSNMTNVTASVDLYNQSTIVNATQNHTEGVNGTAPDSLTASTSCAAYCRYLGFPERTNDINQNDQDSLCNRNTVEDPTWTSCSCGVEVALDGGRTMRIVDGMYVCGDPGFERGLVFVASAGSSDKRINYASWSLAMLSASLWMFI